MLAPSLPDLLAQITDMASAFGDSTSRPATATELTPEKLQQIGGIIQAADTFLAAADVEHAGDRPDVGALIPLVRALRHMAFLVLTRVVPEEAWFWAPEWQAGEREVDANIASGRGTFYADTEELEAAFATVDADLDARAHI